MKTLGHKEFEDIKKLHANGVTYYDIAKKLREAGYVGARGTKGVTQEMVSIFMLRNGYRVMSPRRGAVRVVRPKPGGYLPGKPTTAEYAPRGSRKTTTYVNHKTLAAATTTSTTPENTSLMTDIMDIMTAPMADATKIKLITMLVRGA